MIENKLDHRTSRDRKGKINFFRKRKASSKSPLQGEGAEGSPRNRRRHGRALTGTLLKAAQLLMTLNDFKGKASVGLTLKGMSQIKKESCEDGFDLGNKKVVLGEGVQFEIPGQK